MPTRNYIELVEKTMRVLEVLASEETDSSLKDIAAKAGLVKSSAFRLLFTLRELGYVERNSDGVGYGLSLKIVRLARGAAAKATLVNVARPHMHELREELRESVWLAERMGNHVYLVDVLESDHPIRLSLKTGDNSPLHASAVGKAVASQMTPREIESCLSENGLERYTARTITERAELVEHLSQVRAQGYSVNDEETIEGAILIGAPVFDAKGRVFAAISVSIPTVRWRQENKGRMVRSTTECASRITTAFAELGFESTNSYSSN